VAAVARQADICMSLLYRWRRRSGLAGRRPSSSGTKEVARSSGEPALVVEFSAGPRVSIACGAPEARVAAPLRAVR